MEICLDTLVSRMTYYVQTCSQTMAIGGGQNFSRAVVTCKCTRLTITITAGVTSLRMVYKTMLKAEWPENVFVCDILFLTLVTNEVKKCQINFVWGQEGSLGAPALRASPSYMPGCVLSETLFSSSSWLVSQAVAASSAEWSWDRLPFSLVRGQDSTMWDVVWVSLQELGSHHRSTDQCLSTGTAVTSTGTETVYRVSTVPEKSWKVLQFEFGFFRTWKVLKFDKRCWKSPEFG